MIPPNKNLVIKNKTFVLQEPPKEIFTKPSINILFDSISQEYGENSIGIILSGTGNDGTQGLISIKASGGITFAQIPKTAKYDGMPLSAIESGSVDYEIAPEQFGDIIKRYLMFDENITSLLEMNTSSDELEILLKKVKKRQKLILAIINMQPCYADFKDEWQQLNAPLFQTTFTTLAYMKKS